MLLVLPNAYLSVVADRNNKDRLVVRARRAGHIEAVFPDATVIVRPDSEYRYRAFISRTQFANQISKQAETLDYEVFEHAVKDPDVRKGVDSLDGAFRRQQKTEPFPIPVGGRYPVIRKDCTAIPMKAEVARVRVSQQITPEQFALVKLGLRPDEMEDKWFLYYEEPALHCHRSWTGLEAFTLIFRKNDEGAELTEIVVSQNEGEVNFKDPQEGVDIAVNMLSYCLFHTALGGPHADPLSQWHAHGQSTLGGGPLPGIEYKG